MFYNLTKYKHNFHLFSYCFFFPTITLLKREMKDPNIIYFRGLFFFVVVVPF